MHFYVGQKVVCINDDKPRHLIGRGRSHDLRRGNVYTVAATGLTNPIDPDKLPCIKIVEEREDHAFWAHRFRPVAERKTDISIFTKILNSVHSKEPARLD